MKREIEDKFKSLITDPESRDVVIIEGARQVGKSYMVNHALQSLDKPYLAFDLEKDKKLRRQIDETEDLDDLKALFYDRYNLQDNSLLLLDEAQESDKMAQYVKGFKEDWPQVKVILTGSSMNRFFSKKNNIPVGRTRSITVFGFSFSEFVQYIKGDPLADFLRSAPLEVPLSRHRLFLELLDEYLTTGGYPEAVIAHKNNKNPFDIIDEIMAGLQEDFLRKEGHGPDLFREVVQNIANFIGTPSKLSHFDTSKYMAKKIIESLKTWHIVLEVEQYSLDPMHSNFLPKRYLHDIGVVNRKRTLVVPSISIIDTIAPVLRTPLGGLFENAVLVNLIKGESARYAVGTWKKAKSSEIEVDFTMDLPEQRIKIPIECKATLQVKGKHFKNIVHYLKATGQKFGVLVSAAPIETLTIDDLTIINIPIYLASKENIKAYYETNISR